ncbi:MAG: hypothetical protein K9W44_18400 [Candidatus Lokiarchaeota archaeon]|nr:hypothetical protein [Candidatus Harpocratesius repetitus]
MPVERYLHGIWRFCPDPDDLGITQEWMMQENQPYLEEKTRIIVPSCWNRSTWKKYANYSGVAWYWRIFRVPPQCHDHPTYIVFDGVAHSAKIFIDGKEIGSFSSGFLPFEIDISEFVDDQDHFLAVRVDNSNSTTRFPLIPDVQSYGGIFKDVKIISHEYIIIEERSIETILNFNDSNKRIRNAELTLSLYLRNRSDFDIQGKISITISRDYVPVVEIEKDIEILKQNSRLSKTLIHIDGNNLDLWTPDSPNLYNFKISCFNDELGEIFNIEDIIGIREIEVSENNIMINGKEMNLKGTIFPIDLPEYGYALPAQKIHDMLLEIKEKGYNIIRPNQGVFDRTIIELASRIGILVINDIPIISLSLLEKQQYFNLFANSITFLPALAFYSVNPNINISESKVRKSFEDIQKLFTNRLDPSRYMLARGMFGIEKWDNYFNS